MGIVGNFYICHTENVDRHEIFMREKKKKRSFALYIKENINKTITEARKLSCWGQMDKMINYIKIFGTYFSDEQNVEKIEDDRQR